MAKLLTSVLTRPGSESCSSDDSAGSREALSEEGVTGRLEGSRGYAIRFKRGLDGRSRTRARPASRLLGQAITLVPCREPSVYRRYTGVAGAALELATLLGILSGTHSQGYHPCHNQTAR